MKKSRKYVIRFVIGLKSLLGIGLLIGLSLRLSDQYAYFTSDFPEHEHFAKENSPIIWSVILFLIPLIISLIVDFKEQKKGLLKEKWYIITLSLVVGYVLINQLKGHYLGYIIATVMAIGYINTIRKQKQLEKNS